MFLLLVYVSESIPDSIDTAVTSTRKPEKQEVTAVTTNHMMTGRESNSDRSSLSDILKIMDSINYYNEPIIFTE
jgi:hypothetical protein